jgi:hypothetical protein
MRGVYLNEDLLIALDPKVGARADNWFLKDLTKEEFITLMGATLQNAGMTFALDIETTQTPQRELMWRRI